MTRQVLGEGTGIFSEAAGDAHADDETDGLTLEKRFVVLRLGWVSGQGRQQ
jgi:hypothetical protein